MTTSTTDAEAIREAFAKIVVEADCSGLQPRDGIRDGTHAAQARNAVHRAQNPGVRWPSRGLRRRDSWHLA